MRFFKTLKFVCLFTGILFLVSPQHAFAKISLFSYSENSTSTALSTKRTKQKKTSLWNSEGVKGTTFLGQSPDMLPPIRLESEEGEVRYDYTQSRIAGQNAERQYWGWTLLPNSLIFPSFLAGVNESRMGGVWNNDKDQDWMWDITLGGRAGILRYGNRSVLHPEGWQLDIEGSVHLRLDLENEMDMDANDFRFGLPLSYGTRDWQIRFGYYHVSSHLGDERMIRLMEQGYAHKRINYVREVFIFGYAYKPTSSIRLYAEADFAFERGECTKKWHFQFGAEYSRPYGVNPQPGAEWRGSPFAAINTRLLEEHDFDGNITIQVGWQWRGTRDQLFRIGLQYFGGVSEQYEHIRAGREHKIGLGVWYDF